MAIIKWRPREIWDPFRDLFDIQDEINKIFDLSTTRRRSQKGEMFEGFWSPAVDILNEKESVLVKAEIPGIDPKDLDVKVVGNTLTIKGERKKEFKEEDENYLRIERAYGKFQRAFELSEPIDSKKIEANYKNGVLEIKLPKKEEAKPKEISVKVS